MKRDFKKHSGPREVKEYEEEVLQIDRVTRVVKGGRRMRFRATVILGNRKGKVGVGVGKSEEVIGAIGKAVSDAKKNLINITMDGTTIPHQIQTKYKSAKVLLMPAMEGTGIIAGGPVRKIVELSGIKNIMSKSFGTTNKIACARATIEALKSLRETPFSIRNKNRAAQAKPAAAVVPAATTKPAPVTKPVQAPKTATNVAAPKKPNTPKNAVNQPKK